MQDSSKNAEENEFVVEQSKKLIIAVDITSLSRVG